MSQQSLIDRVAERVGMPIHPNLEFLDQNGAEGLEWYLNEKILQAATTGEAKDHTRVLKYAYNFCLNGARVTFVQEGTGKTPDLEFTINGLALYMEVKKLRISAANPSKHLVEKVVSAVENKRLQLPEDQIGFVAIDNFDLNVESVPDQGFTYEHLLDGLSEVDRLAHENPSGWRPSGVILATHTSGGVSPPSPLSIPHFIWANECAEPKAPASLVGFIRSSLPDGKIFQPEAARRL